MSCKVVMVPGRLLVYIAPRLAYRPCLRGSTSLDSCNKTGFQVGSTVSQQIAIKGKKKSADWHLHTKMRRKRERRERRLTIEFFGFWVCSYGSLFLVGYCLNPSIYPSISLYTNIGCRLPLVCCRPQVGALTPKWEYGRWPGCSWSRNRREERFVLSVEPFMHLATYESVLDYLYLVDHVLLRRRCRLARSHVTGLLSDILPTNGGTWRYLRSDYHFLSNVRVDLGNYESGPSVSGGQARSKEVPMGGEVMQKKKKERGMCEYVCVLLRLGSTENNFRSVVLCCVFPTWVRKHE